MKLAMWESDGDGFHVCSECKQSALFHLIYEEEVLTPYCPFCGAEMVQEEKDGEKMPCIECLGYPTCDDLIKQYCCSLCLWEGRNDCDNCNPDYGSDCSVE